MMISKNSVRWNGNYKRCFCSEPSKIENYDKAIADTTQIWKCHHRLETHTSDGERRLVDLTPEELMALDMYYHRPPEEFVFLTSKDHQSLHFRGKPLSEGRKQKISNSCKGRTSPNKGNHMSGEHKLKMSETHKGKHWKLVDGKRVWY